MTVEILMPALSPTMEEGNLVKWNKKEGDKITPGTVIAEIETDKATMEVESIDEGILGKILIPAGTEKVKVNSIIALLLEEGEDIKTLDSYQPKSPQKITENKENKKEESLAITKSKEIPETESKRIFASPLAKRLAEQNSIQLSKIPGTGPHGRIVKADVLSFKEAPKTKNNNVSIGRNNQEYTEISLSSMRKVIASRLLESKTTIPHFYLSNECIIDSLLEIREELNNEYADQQIKLSVNDFIIKASAMALREVPEVNSSWAIDKIIQYNNIDISVAVAIDGGLITPIIRNADQKPLSVISAEMKDLAQRAKKNILAPHEFQGGGFSISNLGMYGIKKFAAIINPPQSCILAVGASSERVIARNGQMKIVNMVDLSISADHRVIDGAICAKFMSSIKKFIEKPYLMLL